MDMICMLKSLLHSSLIALLYVASLYCWPQSNHRDDPLTIKRRFISVIVTSIIATILLLLIFSDQNVGSIFTKLGLSQPKLSSYWHYILEPLLLTSILFLGSIVAFLSHIYNDVTLLRSHINFDINFIVLRNYIVAPITEEYIFRGVLMAILINCGSKFFAVFISSILFGIAHSHHYLFQQYSHISIIAAFEQMLYTTIFGLYASLLHLKTQFLLTSILVHSYCNFMGLPEFSLLISSKILLTVTIVGLLTWISYVCHLCTYL